MRLIDRLPEEHQRIFEMRFCDELGYREIAADLGISEALARKRVQNLRQMLRAGLEHAEEPKLIPPPSRRKG
jgi:RNA polymerase sigma-70 factor (ECF subfamily)